MIHGLRRLAPRNRLLILGLLLLLLLPAACAQGSRVAEPPEIHYGQDLCDNCGMIINEPRFASAYAYEIAPGRYETRLFDDMGDMVADLKENQEWTVAGLWAHDYYSEEWIDAEDAHYVVSPEIRSPMGHGVAAFAVQADAAGLAAALGGTVVDWTGMRVEMLLHDH